MYVTSNRAETCYNENGTFLCPSCNSVDGCEPNTCTYSWWGIPNADENWFLNNSCESYSNELQFVKETVLGYIFQ
jgi:hypothetical protein